MKYIFTVLAVLAGQAAAVGVTGAAEGFAHGVTGGGDATPVYPSSIDELVTYLSDDEARVIVLDTEYDFTDASGSVSATGCAPWGTASDCQLAINFDDYCTDDEPDAPKAAVDYYAAGLDAMVVGSDKTLIGIGSKGTIKGKGLRIIGTNVIVQNIAITDINAHYVWGGDAIWIDESDLIWIDHVTTARIGRQHIVTGEGASKRVTLSNNYIDGSTSYSATCDGYTYWAILLYGSDDKVTLQNNYIYKTSGRSPKVTGNTVLHAVNNYWSENTGHAFEITSGGYVLAEGNYFDGVTTVISTNEGELFTVPSSSYASKCTTYLKRDCVVNGFENSGTFSGTSDSFFSEFSGYNIPAASTYETVKSDVKANAGQGNL